MYLFTQPGQFDYWSGEYDDAGRSMTGSVYVQEMEALPAAVELKVGDEYEADYGGKDSNYVPSIVMPTDSFILKILLLS